MNIFQQWHENHTARPYKLAKHNGLAEKEYIKLLKKVGIRQDEIDHRKGFVSYSLEQSTYSKRVLKCTRCGVVLKSHVYGYCPECESYAPKGKYTTWEALMRAAGWHETFYKNIWINRDGRVFNENTQMKDGKAGTVFRAQMALP